MTFQQQNPILYPTEGGDPSPMETAGCLRNLCALLFILCALLTVPAISGSLPALALLPAGAALLALYFLFRLQTRLQQIRLIRENAILSVSPVDPAAEPFIVSTFGLLTEGQVHRWGSRDSGCPRLISVEVDRTRVRFTCGSGDLTHWMEMDHGLTSRQQIQDFRDRLRHETGISAIIRDW